KPLQIHTRSDLIAHDDYIEHLNPSMHKIFMHISSLNERVNRILEPGAPSVKRRLDALKILHDSGFAVYVVIDQLKHPKLGKNFQDLMAKEMDVKREAPFAKIEKNPIRVSDKQVELIFKVIPFDSLSA